MTYLFCIKTKYIVPALNKVMNIEGVKEIEDIIVKHDRITVELDVPYPNKQILQALKEFWK